MMEVELGQPLPTVTRIAGAQRVWVLARLLTEPIGTCMADMEAAGISADHLGEVLWRELGPAVIQRFAAAELVPPQGIPAAGLEVDARLWPYLRTRREVLEAPPPISVVICTRNRPDRLSACLRYVQLQRYPCFEVVVVDNCPDDDAAKEIVAALNSPQYRYVVEPHVGLSRARNRGVAIATGEIIAFLDDDEEPDVFWLASLARGFARASDVGCVTGLILPARLDTDAQVLFEELGGHSKDRGFTAALFSADGPQSPLYPRPPFGAGGNMALRRDLLAKIGPFDTALGAGTPARGAEDTLALTLVLLAGARIAYEPAAFVRHHHYSDFAGLARQLSGYSLGLTAFYTALMFRRPRSIVGLFRLLPSAIRYVTASGPPTNSAGTSVRPELTTHSRRALLAGPVAYLRGIVRNVSTDNRQNWHIARRRRLQRRGSDS